MSVKIESALQPFTVPNFVSEVGRVRPRQEGFQELPKHALKELSAAILSDLCDEFRAGVFTKAGKNDPTSRTGETQ